MFLNRTSFSQTNSLKCLKIDDNGLKNFTNIQKLIKLQHLFANSNRINDTPDIEKLIDLPYLKELELNSNPIARKPGYRQTVIRKLPILFYLDGKVINLFDKLKQFSEGNHTRRTGEKRGFNYR